MAYALLWGYLLAEFSKKAQTMATVPNSDTRFAHFPYELRKTLLKRAAGIEFAGAAAYWQSPDVRGEAYVCNMAGAQVIIKLNRFLEPGKKVFLQLKCLTYRGVPFEMTGVVQWCRQLQGGEGLIAVATLVDDTAKREPAPLHESTAVSDEA